ncbi:MAG: hypothetical protein HY226_01015 [Candidatus Vogelbacteria bacterium]|nr:hypothetical protein [Candidatus Vogelbacteria bacterium]
MAKYILVEEVVRKGNWAIYSTVDHLMDREPCLWNSEVVLIDIRNDIAIFDVTNDKGFNLTVLVNRRPNQKFTEMDDQSVDAYLVKLKGTLTK